MPETLTRVVHVNDPDGYDIYIGRANPRRGLKASIWANPYKIGKDGTRDECIAKYREHITGRLDLIFRLEELQGKRLACWCHPDPCHGDVLVELVAQLDEQYEALGGDTR